MLYCHSHTTGSVRFLILGTVITLIRCHHVTPFRRPCIFYHYTSTIFWWVIVQERRNSFANALELYLAWTNLSIFTWYIATSWSVPGHPNFTNSGLFFPEGNRAGHRPCATKRLLDKEAEHHGVVLAWGPFYLTGISAWISNYIRTCPWDVIPYPSPNFN